VINRLTGKEANLIHKDFGKEFFYACFLAELPTRQHIEKVGSGASELN
jgi:hypothetical protein